MARRFKIDSIKKAIKVAKMQVNAQQVLNGRMSTKTQGWAKVNVTEEFREEVINLVCDLLPKYSREETKDKLRDGAQHWGLERMIFHHYKGSKPGLSYCAGQDYPSEIKLIQRNLLK